MSTPVEAPPRDAVRTLRRGLVGLALVAALATASLALRGESLVLQTPLSEDGYYSMTIARNMARGRGITVDGLTPTNGFQPLFTFLSVPVFAIAGADRVLGVRFALVLHWLLYLATALVLGRILRDTLEAPAARALAPWGAAVLYLGAFPVFAHHFNGLETGCLLLLYALALRYAQVHRLETVREAAALGAILGLVVLARIDAVFFVVLVAGHLLLAGALPTGRRLRRAATVAAVSLLVSSPWWLYNVLAFGSLMPSSGAAEQRWAVDPRRIGDMASALLADLSPVYLYGLDERLGGDVVRAALLVAVVLVLWVFRREVGRGLGEWRARHFAGLVRCLLLSALILLLWYTLSSWAVHFYARYLAPLLLLVVLVLARGLLALGPRRPRLALALALVFGASVPVECVRSHFEPIVERNIFARRQWALVEARVPPEDWVAALQTGTLGYLRDRVLNLDGKVNPEALRRRGDIWRYLDERGIRWLCDWPEIFRPFFGSRPEENGWVLVERSGKFGLFRRQVGPGIGK